MFGAQRAAPFQFLYLQRAQTQLGQDMLGIGAGHMPQPSQGTALLQANRRTDLCHGPSVFSDGLDHHAPGPHMWVRQGL